MTGPPGGRLRMAVAAIVVFAVALAGCGGHSGPPPAAVDAFLSAVHTADPQVNAVRSDQSLLRLGEAACGEFSAGASYQTVADQLAYSGLAAPDLGALLTAAADDLCPAYRGQADG